MSHKVESIIRLIDQIRDCSVDVLIQGESGTDKELVARALHYNSPRPNGPFVALNCAALPDNLVEAELFGAAIGRLEFAYASFGAIREKHFREDLYYRVKVIRIQTPPLREITEDIPLLANHSWNNSARP